MMKGRLYDYQSSCFLPGVVLGVTACGILQYCIHHSVIGFLTVCAYGYSIALVFFHKPFSHDDAKTAMGLLVGGIGGTLFFKWPLWWPLTGCGLLLIISVYSVVQLWREMQKQLTDDHGSSCSTF